LTLGLVWGASFMFIELALPGITPFWLAAYRVILASIVTTFVWQMRGGVLYTTDAKAGWSLMFWVSAMSTAFPFMAINWGQQYVTSGFAGVTMAAVALIVLPLAHYLVPGERLTLRKTVGFVIGFLGVLVLIGPGAFQSSGTSLEILGQIACLSAAACYAISSVIMRRIPPVDTLGLTSITLWIGAVLVAVPAFVVEGPPPMPLANVIWVIVTLGLIQTAAATLLRVVVIRTAGPTFMSLVNYMVPVWSVVLGVLILGEPADSSLFAAMLLILVGVLLSQWGALLRLFSKS